MKSQAKQDTSKMWKYEPDNWSDEKQKQYDQIISIWKGTSEEDRKLILEIQIKVLKNRLIKLTQEYLKYE
jgi:hypothetical protein